MIAEALCLGAGMFYHATSFNQDIDNWIIAQVTTMRGKFLLCQHSPPKPLCAQMIAEALCLGAGMFYQAASFNQDIDSWNTGRVKTMYGKFLLCLHRPPLPL